MVRVALFYTRNYWTQKNATVTETYDRLLAMSRPNYKNSFTTAHETAIQIDSFLLLIIFICDQSGA
jgi:hypothetical protein